MPDPPPPKHSRPALGLVPRPDAASVAYAELRCRTNFSFLEGASHPDELVQRAAELGYRALAVTDRNSLAGVVRAHVAAKEAGLKLLVGAEVTPEDAPPAVLLAMDREGYANLSRLITRGRRRAGKGECRLNFEDVAEFAGGLIACVKSQESRVESRESEASLNTCHDAFPHRCYLLAELHHGPDDARQLQRLRELSRATGVPLVAANDVHYHDRSRQPLQDVLTAIRHGCSVAELGERRFPNGERHLKPPAEMARLFAECPEAVARTVEIADRCDFRLDELRYEYPVELSPPGVTPLEYLRRLTWEGARERYPRGLPEKVRGLIEHELALIEELRYEAYFLTVWDLVRFARSRGILCQGRGSAANSAVCYCLGVTSVDPERVDVLFERFVSKERNEAPDIDVDFEHERREEVIQYVYDKYGRERAGMTATVISYRPKSAVRDVGKALGFSLDRVDTLSKTLDHVSDEEQFALRMRDAGLDPQSPVGRRFVQLVFEILGFPRHLSQHVGGLVVTNRPLTELVPIENASMEGRTVVQWDKDDLDAVGLLKVDCLALGMLTAIHRALAMLVERQESRVESREQPSTIDHRPSTPLNTQHSTLNSFDEALAAGLSALDLFPLVPAEDPAVYEMIQRADTMGVFQIESRAQMSMLPRLRPAEFYDLVIEVAIVRPGPIQGDMVHPYLRRRAGEEKVSYPDDRIKAVLHKTLGVPIFQEQAMRLAVVAAGFTPGEADQLRRAMGAWRKRGSVDVFRKKLIEGMVGNGYPEEFAERVFRQIRGFGEYGFPESHAASFALLVYVSAWLKHYHPAAFAAALLNSQPMGFYAPSQLVRDAREHGVEVRPPDVNASRWDCTLESRVESRESRDKPHEQGAGAPRRSPSPALRLGLRTIRGLAESDAEHLVAEREAGGAFETVEEFARRTGLRGDVLQRLARADAFASLRTVRRQALWKTLASPEPPRQLSLFGETPEAEPEADLPLMSPYEEVAADYRASGLSLRAHPLSFFRKQLDGMGVVPAERLGDHEPDRRVKVAGLVLLRQRPGTAKGITFVTLEDETGQANLVIHQGTWERFRRAARTAKALLARGTLQREGEVIHVVVDRLEDLSTLLGEVEARSRDFQ